MSLITGTSIRWGIDLRITSHELTELNYLFFRISCHSIWPISHIHTIPIERCAFLYAFVIDAPMSFRTLFIRSIVGVHRTSAKSHGLFFPASKPVHSIVPIGATFLRQRVDQMKASSKRLRVESSTGDVSQPPSLGDPIAEKYVDPTAAVDPSPSSSSD